MSIKKNLIFLNVICWKWYNLIVYIIVIIIVIFGILFRELDLFYGKRGDLGIWGVGRIVLY